MTRIGIALIGTGKVALANHLPGIAAAPEAALTALCDQDPATLARAAAAVPGVATTTDYHAVLTRADVQAVIVATPNDTHEAIVLAAAKAGKHVLCEKPLGLDTAQAVRMAEAVAGAGVRHMTAFTYRFVPAMRYLAHLVHEGAIGRPYHFRAERFQDWGDRALGWRQVRARAGTGELADMLSHRIDAGCALLGPMRSVVADLQRFLPRRGGQPAELDDWVGMLARFVSGATGVLESTKLATGIGEGSHSPDRAEVNGEAGSLVYQLARPWEILRGRPGGAGYVPEPVPAAFLAWPGSRRDPHAGDPLTTFRYDQVVELVLAIREQRPCRPSFVEGVVVQAIMDALLASQAQERWMPVPSVAELLPTLAGSAR